MDLIGDIENMIRGHLYHMINDNNDHQFFNSIKVGPSRFSQSRPPYKDEWAFFGFDVGWHVSRFMRKKYDQ